MTIEIFVYCLILVQLFVVSLIDIKHKRISNQWVYFNLGLTLFLWLAFPNDYAMNSQKFLYSLTFVAVGFIFYLARIIGAGDSKFLASLFLVIPVAWCEMALYSLFFSTIMIGGFVFFTTVVKSHEQLWVALLTRDLGQFSKLLNNKFSYAPVILVSWLFLGFLLFHKNLI